MDHFGLRSNPIHQQVDDFDELYKKLHSKPITLIKQLQNGREIITSAKDDEFICVVTKKA